MTKAFKENYKLIDWSKPLPVERKKRGPVARSDLPAPRIASDVMAPVQSMATGQMYDSKSAIRAEYRRLGMIEIGNDPSRLRPRKRPKVSDAAINETVEKAVAKFNRGERVTR